MRWFTYLFFIFFSSKFFANSAENLSVFQTQIKDCDLEVANLKSIKNLSKLHAEIQKKYVLISERTLYREVFYQVKNENRKIKVTDDILELYKVADNEKHMKLNIDARHKQKTVQAQISQLTLNAKIENDWQKTLERRENGLKIEIVRIDDKINQLKVNFDKNSKTLDCLFVNLSEVCLCHKSMN